MTNTSPESIISFIQLCVTLCYLSLHLIKGTSCIIQRLSLLFLFPIASNFLSIFTIQIINGLGWSYIKLFHLFALLVDNSTTDWLTDIIHSLVCSLYCLSSQLGCLILCWVNRFKHLLTILVNGRIAHRLWFLHILHKLLIGLTDLSTIGRKQIINFLSVCIVLISSKTFPKCIKVLVISTLLQGSIYLL